MCNVQKNNKFNRRAAGAQKGLIFRSYPHRRYNQLILVSFDSYECLLSENGWCHRVGGVHHVELTPYVQQHKWRKTKSMGNAVFRSLSARKPFDGFSKKFAQLIKTSTSPHVQMLGSVSSKGACLRMREVVAVIFDYF